MVLLTVVQTGAGPPRGLARQASEAGGHTPLVHTLLVVGPSDNDDAPPDRARGPAGTDDDVALPGPVLVPVARQDGPLLPLPLVLSAPRVPVAGNAVGPVLLQI